VADVSDTIGEFAVTRLRSEDTPYLQGAIDSLGPAAIPTVIARGPVFDGPSGAVGAVDWWRVAVTMPAVPEVIWVMIRTQIFLLLDAGISAPARFGLLTFGNITEVDEARGPFFNFGGTTIFEPGAGTNWLQLLAGAATEGDQRWIPLDPLPRTGPNYTGTVNGWTMILSIRAGTPNGPAQDDIRVDMTQVILLGYPVNAWNTGTLWAGTAFRGS